MFCMIWIESLNIWVYKGIWLGKKLNSISFERGYLTNFTFDRGFLIGLVFGGKLGHSHWKDDNWVWGIHEQASPKPFLLR